MIRFLCAATLAGLSTWPVDALADCVGQNLIAALPAPDRAALQAAADAVPFPTGNLWQATKAEAEITLIGTYHLEDPRHDQTLAVIAPFLAQATALLVEAGPAEEAQLQARLAEDPDLLLNTSGPTLPEVLGEEDWTRVSEAMSARQMPAFLAAKMQPWYLTTLLSIPACQFNPAAAAEGLDKRLIEAASARGLPVVALEPYDAVFGIFDSFSEADQLDLLKQTLATMGTVEDDMAITLSDSYFAGTNRLFWEFSKLQALTLPGTDKAEVTRQFALVEEAMINRRNRDWIAGIEAAAAKGPVVVAFGALHLPGQEGVLNLLAMAGWTVTPVAP